MREAAGGTGDRLVQAVRILDVGRQNGGLWLQVTSLVLPWLQAAVRRRAPGWRKPSFRRCWRRVTGSRHKAGSTSLRMRPLHGDPDAAAVVRELMPLVRLAQLRQAPGGDAEWLADWLQAAGSQPDMTTGDERLLAMLQATGEAVPDRLWQRLLQGPGPDERDQHRTGVPHRTHPGVTGRPRRRDCPAGPPSVWASMGRRCSARRAWRRRSKACGRSVSRRTRARSPSRRWRRDEGRQGRHTRAARSAMRKRSWRCWRRNAAPPATRSTPTGAISAAFLSMRCGAAAMQSPPTPTTCAAGSRRKPPPGCRPARRGAADCPRSASFSGSFYAEAVRSDDPSLAIDRPKQGWWRRGGGLRLCPGRAASSSTRRAPSAPTSSCSTLRTRSRREKEQARATVIEAINSLDWGARTLSVRMNGLDTPWMYRDLIEVAEHAGDRVDLIMVRKSAPPATSTPLTSC